MQQTFIYALVRFLVLLAYLFSTSSLQSNSQIYGEISNILPVVISTKVCSYGFPHFLRTRSNFFIFYSKTKKIQNTIIIAFAEGLPLVTGRPDFLFFVTQMNLCSLCLNSPYLFFLLGFILQPGQIQDDQICNLKRRDLLAVFIVKVKLQRTALNFQILVDLQSTRLIIQPVRRTEKVHYRKLVNENLLGRIFASAECNQEENKKVPKLAVLAISFSDLSHRQVGNCPIFSVHKLCL